MLVVSGAAASHTLFLRRLRKTSRLLFEEQSYSCDIMTWIYQVLLEVSVNATLSLQDAVQSEIGFVLRRQLRNSYGDDSKS